MANLSPAEEATSKDEVEIEKFLQEQKSKNTQYKTKSDLNAWKKFCESLKESRAIENIPANELDRLLSTIFISVRKQNGTEYEPGTLSGFQRSFQRYLHEKPSEYLHYNTEKCLHSPTNPASGNFCGAHIDKFEGCTFNINVFCGDQSKIARLNEN